MQGDEITGRDALTAPAAGDSAGKTRFAASRGLGTIAAIVAISTVILGMLYFAFGNAIVPRLVANAISEDMGAGRAVSVGQSHLANVTFSSAVVNATDIVIYETNGAEFLRVPQARVEMDGIPFFGKPVVRRVDLIGATLALAIAADGTLSLRGTRNADDPQAQKAVPAPSAAVILAPLAAARYLGMKPVVSRDWLEMLAAFSSESQQKPSHSFGLRKSQIILSDARSGTVSIASDIDVDMSAAVDGTLSLQVNALSDKAVPWSLTATLSGRPNEERALEARLQNLPVSDIVSAWGLEDRLSAQFPLSATLRARVEPDGAISDIGLQTSGSQTGAVPKPDPQREQVHEFGLVAAWQKGSDSIVIERLQLALDDVRLAMAGRMGVPSGETEPVQFEISVGQVLTNFIVAGQQPTLIERIRGKGSFAPASRVLVIDQAEFGAGQTGSIAVQGEIDFSTSLPGLRLGVASSAMPIVGFLNLWPALVAPKARQWVRENIASGFIDRASFAIKRPATNEPYTFSRDDLVIDASFSDVRLRPQDTGFLPLTLAGVTLVGNGVSASGEVTRGQIDLPNGKSVPLRDTRISVSDHRVPDGIIKITSTLEGSVETIATLLATDAFKDALPDDIDVKQMQGQAVVAIAIQSRVADFGNANALAISIDADIREFSHGPLIGKEKFENGTVKIKSNAAETVVKAEGRMFGVNTVLDYRKAGNPAKTEVKVQTTLDGAARIRLGLPGELASRIAGPTMVRIVGPAEAGARRAVDVDLTPAALTDAVPGWTKPAGQTARLRFNFASRGEASRLEDVVLEGKGVIVRGTIDVDKDGELVSATFPAFHLSDGDKASLKLDRSGQTMKGVLRGDVIDARGLVRQLTDPVQPQRGPPAATQRQQETDLDIKLGAVVGGGGEVLRQVELRMIRRGREVRSVLGSAKVGRGGNLRLLMQQSETTPNLIVYSEDAGATLRFLNIYNALYDGRLIFTGPPAPDGGVRGGVLEVGEFTVRGDEGLSRMLAEPEGAPTAPRPQGQRFESSSFTRLKVDFTRTPGRITVNEALLWGPNLAATVEGTLDISRDRVDLVGTYLPAYALNNLLARIPIIGFVLGGGPTEGLVGINYTISGKASEPRLNINPLSAVTPGILRKILEFRATAQTRAIGNDIPPVR